ncbi:MAG TPA: ATP cone domain-containing protein [Candidatus Nanoarchaeia archaeon]|nr:ATP cone domain-containing protein [Candidatus Nanoarchaeia archaeon]
MKDKTKKSARKLIQIVKRKGHSEIYDERKVFGSCFFACKNAHLSDNEAEAISENVTAKATKWVKERKVVSSNEIFRFMVNELKKHNDDISFLYETHRDIS